MSQQASAVLTVEQMAEADRLSVATGGSVEELMENAGRAVADAVRARWSARPTIVLCGPGNNGGDGFVAARHLAAAGWPVRLALAGDAASIIGPARHHLGRWQGDVESLATASVESAELVIDALFGAGLARPLHGSPKAVLAAAAERGLPIVAVDVPSGVLGNTGEVLGAVAATLTVTFFRKKPAHLLFPARRFCGEVVVADIGIDDAVLTGIAPRWFENHPSLWLERLPQPAESGHKYQRGHALIAGGFPMTGAARLAARAAARMGAGLVSVAVPAPAFSIYATALTSIMVQTADSAAELTQLLTDQRYNALLIGPGAGSTGAAAAATRARVLALLATQRACVLDADALTVFADTPEALKSAIQGPCVLTPHEGEFARLTGVEGNKLSRALAAAAEFGAVVVLKGADTVIAAADGRAIINSNAPATLATAGTGDVLSGLILGLLAQGMEPFLAAAAAVWLHGAAATAFGPGLIAEDLTEALPGVLRSVRGK